MRAISDKEAAEVYGVTTLHQENAAGEVRFRLIAGDGGSYIRTEARKSGAWQESHYHTAIHETYIVQHGWIAIAELLNERTSLMLLGPGDQRTILPGTIHNVYVPAHAIIHTIKHGDGAAADRCTDAATRDFDRVVSELGEGAVRSRAAHPSKAAESRYPEEYRHFDALIWQLPVWCTAIFTLAAAATESLGSARFIINASGLSPIALITGFYVSVIFTLAAFSFVLFRFRIHQRPYKRFTTPAWASAQTYLQATIGLEAATLLLITLLIHHTSLPLAGVISGAFFLAPIIIFETILRSRTQQFSDVVE